MGKRKCVYTDRTAILASSGRQPNFVAGLVCTANLEKKMGSKQRFFSYKITHPNSVYAHIYVMPNNICMLVLPEPTSTSHFTYSITNKELLSGKKKKGATNIKADSVLASLSCIDGTIKEIRSPIGGSILELNDTLTINPSYLNEEPLGRGYLAILLPDTTIPSPDNGINWDDVKVEMSLKGSNICYAWLKGNCHRGNSCRFEHKLQTETESNHPIKVRKVDDTTCLLDPIPNIHGNEGDDDVILNNM